ncbi:hypothetical protein A3D88_01390 [Candidatus Peribacteria bacterium RIFCSPHIGHO2_02_FULL_52_16]|nr:MAG: hypothetical protein A2706_03630 [Candidatus Peribacteria bacterium RIFCSPHIGHO2_01_FULL_51_35]OGJ60973.1 MAG: hypothetical protein A3D88_01390 [Candidatus Peribacteria bacterium RIFCSPHIGHO2_02_FULL_52_16]
MSETPSPDNSELVGRLLIPGDSAAYAVFRMQGDNHQQALDRLAAMARMQDETEQRQRLAGAAYIDQRADAERHSIGPIVASRVQNG